MPRLASRFDNVSDAGGEGGAGRVEEVFEERSDTGSLAKTENGLNDYTSCPQWARSTCVSESTECAVRHEFI